MFKSRKKITKKELKHDKLVTWYFMVSDKAKQYQNQIITVVVALLVVALLVFFMFIKPNQEDEEIASTALGNISAFYDYKQYQMAVQGIPERNIIGLTKIVSDYGSTKAGQIAKIYLGNIYLAMGDYDNAFKNYDDFNGREKMFLVASIVGKASVYEAKGQYLEAATEFERAGNEDKDNLKAAEIFLSAAKNYALSGNKTKAVEMINKIKQDYATSTVARESDRYLAEYQY